MLAFISIFSLIARILSQPSYINKFVAIQNTSEVFFAYLPYFSTCTYPQPYFIPGSVELNEINPENFYQFVVQEGTISFWTTVRNGLDIALVLNQSISNYTGYILYDSKYQKLNRPIILFNSNQNGLTFYYTLVTINTQTMQLSFSVQKTTEINLQNETSQILTNCNNVSGSNFAYLSKDQFIFVCGEDNSGFIFSPSLNTSQVIDLSNLPSGEYSVTTNPNLLNYVDQKIPIIWNDILLITNGNFSALYFIIYDYQFVTILSVKEYGPKIIILFDQIWSSKINKQFSRWMDISSTLHVGDDLYFPGDIVSVYVSSSDNIYVQSVTEQQVTYLCAFNNQQVYWNVSFQGSVVYYGEQKTYIFDNQTKLLYSIYVSRPIYLIYPVIFGNQTQTFNLSFFKFNISCQSLNISVVYSISWSNIDFPTALVYVQNTFPIQTTDSVYAVQVQERYIIVGPDFSIIPNSPPNIQLTIYSYQSITLNTKAIGIINIQYQYQNSKGVFIVTTACIYFVNIKGELVTLINDPCGFDSITQGFVNSQGEVVLIDSNNQACVCQTSYFSCHISPQNQAAINDSGNSSQQVQQNNANIYKKILFNLQGRGYIVIIFVNNTVALVSKQTQQFLSTVSLQCPNQNTTNGVIFTTEFALPSVLLFCEQNTTLTQYVIYQEAFYFQRVIPIYGFQTRSGQYVIRSTAYWVFLAVTPIYQVNPQPESCCVLRLDPNDFTVSVINDIIQSQHVIATASNQNFDFVLLSSLTKSGYVTLVNIYLPEQWMVFNMTQTQQILTVQQQINISFQSPIYNLAAYEEFQFNFNMTKVNVSLLTSNKQVITLNTIQQNRKYPEYIAQFSYNLSEYVCGPIFDFVFFRSNYSNKDIQINQNNILTRTKFLGNPHLSFIQIIDPEQWKQPIGSTLNGLLILISVDRLYIYSKVYQDIQLYEIASFLLPSGSCTYYPYKVINQTSMQFTSSCFGYNLNFDLQTPLITINYNPNNSQIFCYFTMIQISLFLRNIQTNPLDSNHTIVFGIMQGPMLTATGRLVMCSNNSCSPLYISSKQSFLLDYSFYRNVNQNQTICESYFIMTLDTLSIGIYVNPTVKPYDQPTTPNYTFFYLNIIKQPYCSTMSIVNATLNFTQILLACSNYYYYVLYNFTLNKGFIKAKFSRYSQCALFDDFDPQFVYNEGNLEAVITQCRQNDYYLQINAYQGFRNNFNPIYTGYLQIFIMNGPLGPGCSVNTISPARLIPISVEMSKPLFTIYKMQNFTKFLYCQLKGVIVDNFFETETKIKITFQPTGPLFTFPSIAFLTGNQFHYRFQQIETQPGKTIISNYRLYLSLIFYGLFNLITLIFFCGYVRNRNKVQVDYVCQQLTQFDQLQYEADRNTINLKFKDRHSLKDNRQNSRNKTRQIQMFFIKPENQRNYL